MNFRTCLSKGFVLTAEINPPLGVDVRPLLEKVAPIAGAFDAFAVTDDSLAKLRMNAMAFSHLVHERFRMPLLMHLTCRDMSILKITDYLLGAWALDIRNVVCMTGDPPRIGTFPDVKGVYQLNSVQLCSLVRRLNRGLLHDGSKLRTNPDFFVGCVANPYSPNLKSEAGRLRKKHEAGAEFVITQPVYTRRILDQFLEATADVPLKKIIGVLPLRGLENAHVIAESVPDIYMPADIFRRLTKNDSLQEGIALAREFIADVKDQVDGIHIFPLNHIDVLLAVIEEFPERAARARARKDGAARTPPAGLDSGHVAAARTSRGNGRGRRRPD